MGKMMTLDVMRQLLKEWTLPDRVEVTWDMSNSQDVIDAEKKFRDYLAEGWLAFDDNPKEGRIQIFNFDPKLKMIILLPPLGGG